MDALRGELQAGEAVEALLFEASKQAGIEIGLHGDLERRWQNIKHRPIYPHLQAAARALLLANEGVRLRITTDLLRESFRRPGIDVLDLDTSRLIVGLLGTPASLRASFAHSVTPVLCAARDAKDAGRPMRTRFVDPNRSVCDLVTLIAALIGVKIEVVGGDPLMRIDEGAFEAELVMSPFGIQLPDREALPRRILDRLGASEKARLQYEATVIADALACAPHAQVVMNFPEGVLLRAVGVEAAMREDMVESGRLRSVFKVPPGMLFAGTAIVTSFVVLEPEDTPDGNVRFLDLEDDKFSRPGPRGRREVRPNASWEEASTTAIEEGASWARDVPVEDIRKLGHVLTVPRYLQTQAAALGGFLERHETTHLDDVVEIIRAKALPKSEEGDYHVREASPGDISVTGYLGEPPREVRLARAGLRVARNQQVRPGDVLLSIKGTIGRSGLVPDDAPEGEDGFWTVSQSLVILRPRGRIASEALYEYLASDVVQDHLMALAGGAVIKSITAKDLAALEIPIPDEAEQARIAEALRNRLGLHAQIDRLHAEIAALRASAWPHRELAGERS